MVAGRGRYSQPITRTVTMLCGMIILAQRIKRLGYLITRIKFIKD